MYTRMCVYVCNCFIIIINLHNLSNIAFSRKIIINSHREIGNDGILSNLPMIAKCKVALDFFLFFCSKR